MCVCVLLAYRPAGVRETCAQAAHDVDKARLTCGFVLSLASLCKARLVANVMPGANLTLGRLAEAVRRCSNTWRLGCLRDIGPNARGTRLRFKLSQKTQDDVD